MQECCAALGWGSEHKETLMSMQTLFLSMALALGASALSTTSRAAYVEVDAAPPALQQEAVPEQRAGYIWVPGYWGWSGSQHVWVNGQYVPERLHHHWVTRGGNSAGRNGTSKTAAGNQTTTRPKSKFHRRGGKPCQSEPLLCV